MQNYHLRREGVDVEVTSTHVDTEPGTEDWRSLGLTKPKREYVRDAAASMERRGAESAEADIVETNKLHNEAVRDLAHSLEQDEIDERDTGISPEHTRAALWWRSQRERFDGWRDQFREQAAEWVQHFRAEHPRISRILPWFPDPPALRDDMLVGTKQPDERQPPSTSVKTPVNEETVLDHGTATHEPPERLQ